MTTARASKGRPGLNLYAAKIGSGERVLLRPGSQPREQWLPFAFALPPAWQGQQIRLLAEDRAGGAGGWFGFSEPTSQGRLYLFWVRGFLRLLGAVFVLTVLILLATTLLRARSSAAHRPDFTLPLVLSTAFSVYLLAWMSLLASPSGIRYTSLATVLFAALLFWHVARRRGGLLRHALRVALMPAFFLLASALIALASAFSYGDVGLMALIVGVMAAGLLTHLFFRRRIFSAAASFVAACLLFSVYFLNVSQPGTEMSPGSTLFSVSALLGFAAFLWLAARGLRLPALNRRRLYFIFVWLFAAAAVTTFAFHWQPVRSAEGFALLPIIAAYLLTFAICFAIYRYEAPRLSNSYSLALVLLIVVLTCVTNNLHFYMVDNWSYAMNTPNIDRQVSLQNYVMLGSPQALPHSYRFLPNVFVRWLELVQIPFAAARDLYRLIFGLLLFYALYRYARLFTSFRGAILALALVAAVYPVSFEYYAGQLTDPLSHLSFVLALIFLETLDFPALPSTILIGSLAKETVLAMMGYYVLFCRFDRGYWGKAAVLCIAGIGSYFGVRLFVLNGNLGYSQISGVTLAHVSDNWGRYAQWLPIVLLTGGAFLPFLIIGWKRIPLSLKRQGLFLFPVLFVSSLFFSWLPEGRNFMPEVFVLAVAASVGLVSSSNRESPSGIADETIQVPPQIEAVSSR